jgi:prepilin-type N-terminal cleavage/methylation domain-containing protein
MRLTSRPRVRGRRTARRGFTLIETALTTVIIGVGVLALIEAQQAFMRSNSWSTHAATATYLANEIREMTRQLPRHDPVTGLYIDGNNVLRGWGPEPGETEVSDLDDIDDFDGLTFSPTGTPGLADDDLPGPIDAFGEVIPEITNNGSVRLDANDAPMPLQGWTQTIKVTKVDPTNPSTEYEPQDVLAPQTGFTGLRVNRFPLRVSVTVRYQGPYDEQPQDITTVTWIVP